MHVRVFIFIILFFSIVAISVSATVSVSNVVDNNMMMIWDDTNDIQGQNRGHYPNEDLVGFFANYTNISGHPINGSGVYCQIIDNSLGWNGKANMTYNATSKIYNIYKNFTVAGIFYFNVVCNGISQGHGRLNTTDDFYISVLGAPAYHYEYPIPTDRLINLRPFNITDPIVYHGIQRAYYQKLLKDLSGMYYIYYSDLNATGGVETFVANSTSGDRFQYFAISHRPSGHPLVSYSADGFGLNNNYMFWSWDEVSPGHISPYKRSIMLYYGNYSNLSGLKSMGYVNFTWMMGTSNNGTISGTYGINHMFYNASGGDNGKDKNPFNHKFAIYFDCAGGSAENLCVVGSDDPLKFNRTSLHKVLMNDTPGAWDNLKLGYGDVQRFKGYYLAIYEGGKTTTREGTGLAYGANGSGRFTRLPINPILKRSTSVFLNKSVGGASFLIEGDKVRLYVAGLNNTGSMYQVVEYLYDVRRDRNFSLFVVPNTAVIISNTSNGILYNYRSAKYGDRISLLEGMEYNIMVQPTNQQYIRVNRLNVSKTNTTNMVVSIFNLNVSIPGIIQLTRVIGSNATGFNSTTIYFLKTFNATKVCYCQSWNFSANNCPAVWSCSPISNYHMKSNSSHTWINVTHFSSYVLGTDIPYVAPSVIGVGVGTNNVLAGQNVSMTITVEAGRDDLSSVWFKYNNTIGGSSYAINGSNNFVFNTDGLYGNYTISGYVNDSNNTIRSMSGPSVNIYTTTTTTTTLKGSVNIVVSGGGSVNSTGTKIVITSNNGTVIINSTTNQSITNANTSVLTNAVNYAIKVTTPKGDGIKLNGYDFTKVGSQIGVQASNLSGIKPSILKKYNDVIASNVSSSSFGIATLSFNISFSPNYLCRCVNWNYLTSTCNGGGWICNYTSEFQHKFASGKFLINVSHFSAYVVGSGISLLIWDDTNDLEGQHIKHYANQYYGFYANYTNGSNHAINSSMGGYCTFNEMSSGYWSAKVNMSYNSTSGLYYIYKNISANPGVYLYNVTCSDFTAFYERLTALDNFVVSARMQLLSSIDWAEVYWWTAETIAHTLHYGIYNTTIACDQNHLFYIDGMSGTQKKINASTDKSGHYKCQNSTQGVFVISNDGSVSINVNSSFNQVTHGVTMKLGNANSAWQDTCDGSCSSTSCDLMSSCLAVNITQVRILYSLPVNSSKQYWMWADFKGVAGTNDPTKGNFTTIATKTE